LRGLIALCRARSAPTRPSAPVSRRWFECLRVVVGVLGGPVRRCGGGALSFRHVAAACWTMTDAAKLGRSPDRSRLNHRAARPRSVCCYSECHCVPAVRGSYGRQIERVVKLFWQSSDVVSTERSRESSMDVTTSHEPDALRDDVPTHHAHSGPLVAHGASNLATVLTTLPHTLAGEACREPGSADIRANLFIVQRGTHGSASR
jgi:hypothetical protein